MSGWGRVGNEESKERRIIYQADRQISELEIACAYPHSPILVTSSILPRIDTTKLFRNLVPSYRPRNVALTQTKSFKSRRRSYCATDTIHRHEYKTFWPKVGLPVTDRSFPKQLGSIQFWSSSSNPRLSRLKHDPSLRSPPPNLVFEKA